MTEEKYMDKELEGRIKDAGTYYQGMRQLLESPEMPEDMRKSAGNIALALMASREHDALPQDHQRGSMNAHVLRTLVAYAIRQTPLKDVPESEYRRF